MPRRRRKKHLYLGHFQDGLRRRLGIRDLPQPDQGRYGSHKWDAAGQWSTSRKGKEATMLADTSEIVGAVAVFLFVFVTLGFLLYAFVRPFTHTDYEHRSSLWVHLP
jgi:hypothetical protein